MSAPAGQCRICSGPLELRFRGTPGGPSPESFSPTYHGTGQHGDLYICRECATVQQPSLPGGDALHGLYREMSDQDYLVEEEGRRATARRLLEQVGGYVAHGSLLDVGCGHGVLLDEARKLGYETTGPRAVLRRRAARPRGATASTCTRCRSSASTPAAAASTW